jgi:hypothetical protein
MWKNVSKQHSDSFKHIVEEGAPQSPLVNSSPSLELRNKMNMEWSNNSKLDHLTCLHKFSSQQKRDNLFSWCDEESEAEDKRGERETEYSGSVLVDF